MDDLAKENAEKALRAIASMIGVSEKAQGKFAQGTSQHTLLKNRLKALRVASTLIRKATAEEVGTDDPAKDDLEEALAPIASLISKSEKARKKLAEGTWQHTMLSNHLEALYMAYPLIKKALSEGAGKMG